MVYTGLLATEAELNAKAGENVDLTGWTEANKNLWIAQAEAYLTCLSKFNWQDNYSSLNADVKTVLSEAVSNLVAIYGIQYNMAGFTSRIEAEDMVNILWARFQQCAILLRDQTVVSFMDE